VLPINQNRDYTYIKLLYWSDYSPIPLTKPFLVLSCLRS
jgi:hypothetical protein